MSSVIKPLPTEVVDLIAAGEVIDSMGAVVRELVENALDAKSSRICISITPESWRIIVSDNGRGISIEDLRICAQPHSTSKITTSQDLWNITSLGFRGEALHSISQVADLTICSRSRSETLGWKVTYRQGNPILEEAIAMASGTIVTVSNLFNQLPVRRRGLPSEKTQLKAIQKIIQYLALTHPQITWQVKQGQKPWFHISPGNTAQQIFPQILKKIQPTDFQYLKLNILDDSNAEKNNTAIIELILGLPDRAHRHKPDWIKVAVNQRIVRGTELEQVIISSMDKTLPRDRSPIALVHLHLNPTQIDWNRHPAKTEIYLYSIPYWQEQLSIGIDRALCLNNDRLPSSFGDRRISKIIKEAEGDRYKTRKNNYSSLKKNIGAFQLKAVAQINNTYIVAEYPDGLWLVEQHIAHERILYEELQDSWKIIPLKNPIIISNLRQSQIEQLERINITIEPFGEQLWAVRNAPASLASRKDCQDALLELSWGGDLKTAQVAIACRTAIRNGTPLDLPTMQNILERWQSTRNPRTCPHGRPIYLALEESALARFFRRHWVIGKSHGIN